MLATVGNGARRPDRAGNADRSSAIDMQYVIYYIRLRIVKRRLAAAPGGGERMEVTIGGHCETGDRPPLGHIGRHHSYS